MTQSSESADQKESSGSLLNKEFSPPYQNPRDGVSCMLIGMLLSHMSPDARYATIIGAVMNDQNGYFQRTYEDLKRNQEV